MNLIARINDLLTANAHHAIDQVENPEVMLKQVIRDMDRNIDEARSAVISAVAGEKQLAAQARQHRTLAEDFERRAECALQAGREDLARQALARKVDHARIVADLERSHADAGEICRRVRAQLDMLIARRADACRRKDMLIARQRAAQARARVSRSLAAATIGDTSGEKFNRMQQRVAQMEAEAAATSDVFEEPAKPDQELDELETAAAVDDALTALKARLAGGEQAAPPQPEPDAQMVAPAALSPTAVSTN
jgi:phage shock protein A